LIRGSTPVDPDRDPAPPVHLTGAELEFPENRHTPIAARLTFTGGVTADFDWRQVGPQTWDIEVQTDAGTLTLRHGGNLLLIDGVKIDGGPEAEYPALYARMAELVAQGQSEVDLAPMVHVADAPDLGPPDRHRPIRILNRRIDYG
jgi:D-galactose 1-dehydrogenase